MEYKEQISELARSHPCLAEELATFVNLAQVLGWIKRKRFDFASLDLVTQDEFCHDLFLPLPDQSAWLVFGVT